MKLLTYEKECKHPVVTEPDVIKVKPGELKMLPSQDIDHRVIDLYHRGTGSAKDNRGKYVDVFA